MPNDDLGQFPMPTNTPPTQEPQPTTPTTVDTTPSQPQEPSSTFEETPEEIPSMASQTTTPEPPPPTIEESPIPPVASDAASIPSPYIPQEPPQPLPPANPQPPIDQPIPATLPTSSRSSMGPIVFAVVFIVAVISIAGAAFLYQQSQSLRNQLNDITKTLEKQETSPETTPTPSVVEVPVASPTLTPSPTTTPTTTISATPILTPTPQVFNPGTPMKPLSISSKVLQIAIKHQPNAQLILIKSENANDPIKATTKYFFRQDLVTKKYFYVLISGSNEPEVVDKQIYVTPDDNIPSLNDLVLQDTLGIDLDEAISITNANCLDINVCTTSQAKAQFIKTTAGVIWQVSLTPAGRTQPMVIQINSQTKAVLFKTTDFGK